jgi:hypothetical protein
MNRSPADQRASFRKQRRRHLMLVVLLCLFWYGATVVESHVLGVYPLGRRPFSTLDWLLLGGILALIAWSGWALLRCPQCGKHQWSGRHSECSACGARLR